MLPHYQWLMAVYIMLVRYDMVQYDMVRYGYHTIPYHTMVQYGMLIGSEVCWVFGPLLRLLYIQTSNGQLCDLLILVYLTSYCSLCSATQVLKRVQHQLLRTSQGPRISADLDLFG